jgi:hypothetical protein
LRLVDPVLKQTRGCDIPSFVAEDMSGTHAEYKRFGVLVKFAQHVLQRNVLCIVVDDSL